MGGAVNVLILGADSRPPFGILQVDSREPRPFNESDITFLRGYANLLAAAVDRLRVLGEIRSALSFAVSLALAVAIPGAGPGIAAFLQTTALNIAANVASNFVIKMGDYGLDDLKADVGRAWSSNWPP